MHGDVGQTQFAPESILAYGIGGNLDDATDALAPATNFLKAREWHRAPAVSPAKPTSA